MKYVRLKMILLALLMLGSLALVGFQTVRADTLDTALYQDDGGDDGDDADRGKGKGKGQDGDDAEGDDELDTSCVGTEVHPIGEKIAEKYGQDYEQVMAWFCEGFGFGEIMLALETGKLTNLEADTLLHDKGQGNGWGNIWKDLGLIGRPEDAGPPAHVQDRGKGRPDDAGPPDDKGKPDDAGSPDDADDGDDTDRGKGKSDENKGDDGDDDPPDDDSEGDS